MKMIRVWILISWLLPSMGIASGHSVKEIDGWNASSPRDEIRPEFDPVKNDGPRGGMSLITRMDAREGLQGAWRKTYVIEGGTHYRFSLLSMKFYRINEQKGTVHYWASSTRGIPLQSVALLGTWSTSTLRPNDYEAKITSSAVVFV